MSNSQKKSLKAASKIAKKAAKAHQKSAQDTPPAASPSKHQPPPGRAVRFAETVRGILFLVFAVSLAIALLTPDLGQILGLGEIINRLIGHWGGKIVLAIIAAAFFIYGLKYLHAIK